MIYEATMYSNESLVARIKIDEYNEWVDELHIVESNKTFSYLDKGYNFEYEYHPMVRYLKIDGRKQFKRPGIALTFKPWFVTTNNKWGNEARQRNLSCSKIAPDDDDIVIIADIDEIIDSRSVEKIIHFVKIHKIVTIKLYFTLYYFNLFSMNWGGPPDYGYRVFIMTGSHFNSMKITADQLRKKGEAGKLINEVYCVPGFSGFHHSWLGDETYIMQKLLSYSHDKEEHDTALFGQDGNPDPHVIRSKIVRGESLFGVGHKLAVRDDVDLLRSVLNEYRGNDKFFL